MYGSKESIDFIDCFMEAMNYYSLKASMEIAKERGETFYRFEESDYASGVYFDHYVNKEEEVYSASVLKALGNVPIITQKCGSH